MLDDREMNASGFWPNDCSDVGTELVGHFVEEHKTKMPPGELAEAMLMSVCTLLVENARNSSNLKLLAKEAHAQLDYHLPLAYDGSDLEIREKGSLHSVLAPAQS
jgi:hypothetical protein